MKRIISFILIFNMIIFSFPLYAMDVESLGLNVPNIQNISPSEQSGPKNTGDMVLEAPIDIRDYRLGPGDTVTVHIIIGDANLFVDQGLFIGADGKAYFPNIGEIYLSGLNLIQAKAKINAAIRSIYKEKYSISVLLTQPKKVKIYMTGMVKNPGPLTINDNSRISEVLSQAGGVASGASNRYIYIKRKNSDGEEKLLMADLFEAYRNKDLEKDIRIQAGDVVEVPDALNVRISQNKASGLNEKLLFEGRETFIYIYGEVARSGRYEYVPGKRISDYISYAGGPTGRALLSSVNLTRQLNGKATKYAINVSDVIYNGDSKNDIEVYGGDVINVPGNFFYFSDLSSFASIVFTGLALYNLVIKY